MLTFPVLLSLLASIEALQVTVTVRPQESVKTVYETLTTTLRQVLSEAPPFLGQSLTLNSTATALLSPDPALTASAQPSSDIIESPSFSSLNATSIVDVLPSSLSTGESVLSTDTASSQFDGTSETASAPEASANPASDASSEAQSTPSIGDSSSLSSLVSLNDVETISTSASDEAIIPTPSSANPIESKSDSPSIISSESVPEPIEASTASEFELVVEPEPTTSLTVDFEPITSLTIVPEQTTEVPEPITSSQIVEEPTTSPTVEPEPTTTLTVEPEPTTSLTVVPEPTPTTTSESPAQPTLGEFEQQILDTHNQKRALHGVGLLTWDASYADYALNYAKSVVDCNNMQLIHSNGPYGENLAAGYVGGVEPVDAWYDEIKLYDFNNPGFSHGTGHFTQVVWKLTKRVGCAKIMCDNEWRQYTICEYGDGTDNVIGTGNVVGTDPATGKTYFEENVLPPLSS